ncbi:MAG: RelA/SpoT domain-containing protein, partial [Nanoarchaeota archaeon]|nr:RelA/SpoT domain-containing protein [Nanoarchaeota archaeon]
MTEYNAELYGRFVSTIKFLLEQLLSQNDFRAQFVAARVKNIISLRKKIKKNGAYLKMKSVAELDDLAGCRIIFYIEKDVDRIFPLIRKAFKIVNYKLRYSTDRYNATHIIVSLKKDRLKLIEYSAFANLKCEIQMTTVLHHAWSELEHDVIYKPDPSLFEFAPEVFESIKGRFTDVMEKHIKEAQRSFDYIFEELEKLKQGKKIFDNTFIASIEDTDSNNAIHERLKLLLQYIEQYGDKTPPDIDIIKILRAALEKAKALPTKPLKTPLGEFDGRSYDDVVAVVLDILKRLRFVYLDKVFTVLTELSTD